MEKKNTVEVSTSQANGKLKVNFKKILAGVAVLGMLGAAGGAIAWDNDHDGDGYVMHVYHDMSKEMKSKITAFKKENLPLQKKIVMKQAELETLKKSAGPTPKDVAAAIGELFDLQTALHEKAEAAGLDQYQRLLAMEFGLIDDKGIDDDREDADDEPKSKQD